MTARRGATDLAGLLVVDKPAGITSHGVVNAVRRYSGERRVGHAGTLDPAATGVLLVLVGPYTRLARYLSGAVKSYDAIITFGSATDTDDAEGQVTRTAPVPEDAFDPSRAQAVLEGFLGTSMQSPPVYSAIKRDGKTAHRVARAGGDIDLEPREITVHDASLLSVDPASCSWTVRFLVSKGTYIRALARDIGARMGTAAHLSSLRRVASGVLDISQATTLEAIESAAPDLRPIFADPVSALGFPVLAADAEQAARVADGRPLAAADLPDGRVSVVREGKLLAVYVAKSGKLSAETVLGARA